MENKTLRFVWFDQTKKHNKTRRGQKVDNKSFEEANDMKLAVPPMWKRLTLRKRRERIEELVKNSEVRYGRQRRAEGLTVFGAKQIIITITWISTVSKDNELKTS